MSASSVVLDHVSVAYGANTALRDVSAVFPTGAVGLLGPNGAGKSTMLKSLLGFIAPAKGRLEVLGINVAERPLDVRAKLGYMPETDGHIPGMNAVTFVGYCGQLAGLPRTDAIQRAHEVLYYVGLGEARKADGVFLGSHDHLEVAPNAASDETLQLRFRVAVMIGVTLR